jgi:hypothetical protein
MLNYRQISPELYLRTVIITFRRHSILFINDLLNAI